MAARADAADGAEAGEPGDLLRAAGRLPRRCSRSGAATPAIPDRSSTPTARGSARTPATPTTPSGSATASASRSARRSTSARCSRPPTPSSSAAAPRSRSARSPSTARRFTAGTPPRERFEASRSASGIAAPDVPAEVTMVGARPVRGRDRRAGVGAGAGPGGGAVRRRRVPRRGAHRSRRGLSLDDPRSLGDLDPAPGARSTCSSS